MKKFLITLSLLAAMILPANLHAQKVAYRGFIDVAGGAPDPCFVISSTHGIQCSSKYFIGIGADFNMGSGLLEYTAGFSFYLRNRFDFPNAKKWHPFVELDTGANFAFDEGPGFNVALSPGFRYNISNWVGLNLGLYINFRSYDHYYDKGNYYDDGCVCFCIGARIGVDF